jgi:hypothetical protein
MSLISRYRYFGLFVFVQGFGSRVRFKGLVKGVWFNCIVITPYMDVDEVKLYNVKLCVSFFKMTKK